MDKLEGRLFSADTTSTSSNMYGQRTSRVFLSTRHADLPVYAKINSDRAEFTTYCNATYCKSWLKVLSVERDEVNVVVPKPYTFDRDIVGMKKKHRDSTASSCHTTETLKRLSGEIERFGYAVNELEYSASLMFTDGVRIETDKSDRDLVYWNRRRYYKNERYVASDGHIVTSDPCQLPTGDKRVVVLRLDERAPGTHTEHPWVTAKLKLLTDHLLVDGCRINLTAAIEALVDDSSFAKRDSSKNCWAKRLRKSFVCRRFCYWKLVAEHGGREYAFRVAFRQKEKREDCYTPLERGFNPEEAVEMNVECEQPITRTTFVDIFHALTIYYKYMWVSDLSVRPVMTEGNWASFIQDETWREKLNDAQVETLRSLRLSEWSESDCSDAACNVHQFVKFLGLQTYVALEGSILSTSEPLNAVVHSKGRIDGNCEEDRLNSNDSDTLTDVA